MANVSIKFNANILGFESYTLISEKLFRGLFKKIIYKVVYKNKKNTLSFKNTYGAAKMSLEGVEKINNNIKY